MRIALLLILLVTFRGVVAADVWQCGEPRGISMWSNEAHKPALDGFAGVEPVVTIDRKEMTVAWGDTKLGVGAEKIWKLTVVHAASDTTSGIALDADLSGSALMLYTLNKKSGYLYESVHKNNNADGLSIAASYVAKCSRR